MNSVTERAAVTSSFRDPAGFLFKQSGRLFRQIEANHFDNYHLLMSSGLYQKLVKENLLIAHDEVTVASNVEKVIEPVLVPFISYPYEWSFSALKSAALLTLRIQEIALQFGMSLKDASAYNVQFIGTRPIFIDTLSFEKWPLHRPWIAYRQFCQHFLAPLALASKVDVRLSFLLQQFLDGIPLDLASALLPFASKLTPSLLAHIHLHAKAIAHYADKKVDTKKTNFSKNATFGLVDSLKNAVAALEWRLPVTEWGDYYQHTNYTKNAFVEKQRLVNEALDIVKPNSVWDLGANSGEFSKLSAQRSITTMAFDLDPVAVEKNFQNGKQENSAHLLPLVLDITNPSPSVGFHLEERDSLLARGPADLAMALGLIHHLVISNNTPLAKVAKFLSCVGVWLVIEFIEPDDSQVQRLMAHRTSATHDYSRSAFEVAFGEFFRIEKKSTIADSKRIIYLMRKR